MRVDAGAQGSRVEGEGSKARLGWASKGRWEYTVEKVMRREERGRRKSLGVAQRVG